MFLQALFFNIVMGKCFLTIIIRSVNINMYKIIILLIFTTAISSCISQTPGDAAMRSCHAKQAGDLYEQYAIQQKDLLATIKLARMYNYGVTVDHCNVKDKTGFDQNKQKAIYWYKKASEYGDVVANWNIGTIYKKGEMNVKQDFAKAEKWFLKGAKMVHHNAMYDLADMHANNEVPISNDIEGLKWLNIVQTLAKSYDKDNEYAQFILKDEDRIREKLESRMKDFQINKARALSEAFIKQYNAKHK